MENPGGTLQPSPGLLSIYSHALRYNNFYEKITE